MRERYKQKAFRAIGIVETWGVWGNAKWTYNPQLFEPKMEPTSKGGIVSKLYFLLSRVIMCVGDMYEMCGNDFL
mgnify:CR=1 FL=1